MAQIPYRANLSASLFPMTIAKSGQTVINPGMDQNFDKRVDPGASYGSVGIPQVMYCENVIPTSDGFQTVENITTGTINLHGSSMVDLETVRLAVAVEQSSVVVDVDFDDEGDDLPTWTKTADRTDAHYSTVTQDNAVGDPAPSYLLTYDENDNNVAAMWKSVGTTGATSIDFSFDHKGTQTSTNHKDLTAKFFTTSSGSGPLLGIIQDAGVLTFYLGTSPFFNPISGITTLVSVVPTEYIDDQWYTFKVTGAKNIDNTWTLNATMENKTTTTIVGSLLWTGNLPSVAGYIGFMSASSLDDSAQMKSWIDNISMEADIPDVDYTSVAGITNIDIVFLADNTAYWSHGNIDGWEDNDVIVPVGFESPQGPDRFSWAFVRGECYVAIKKVDDTIKIYHLTYDDVLAEITFVDITTAIAGTLGIAFDINNVIGIVGSYNYLILLTPDSAIWSSTTNAVDFAPSLVSGAGSTRVSNLKGDIRFARDHVNGFFLYSNNNVVFSSYTGNARYPWKFREVSNSSGFTYSQQVTGDTNSPTQFGISNSKNIQNLAPSEAQIIAPEVTNFLERTTRWDEFDYDTNLFTVNAGTSKSLLPANGKYKLWYVLDRYILVAYSINQGVPALYDSLLVFDTTLSRYGKIKGSFLYILSNEYAFYLVDAFTGEKKKLIMDTYSQTSAARGVLLLGKFQEARGKFLTLDELTIESVDDPATTSGIPFATRVFPTYDGKTFLPSVAPIVDTERTSGALVSYHTRISANNFCVLIKGVFDLNCLTLTFHRDGSR